MENVKEGRWDQVSTFLPVVMDKFRGNSKNPETRELKKIFNTMAMVVNYYAPGGGGENTYKHQRIQSIDGISFHNEKGEIGMHYN